MKKISVNSVIRMLLICMLGLVSCQELTIDSQPDAPLKMEIDAQSEYTLLATIPRDIVFNISSNSPWRIESDQNWCIPSPALSAASSLVAEITVKVEKNETEKPRTATLTIKADGIEENKTVVIKQDAKGKLEVQPIDDMFHKDGGDALFTVCSNKSWTITSSNMWLSFDKSEGNGTGQVETIKATAAVNKGAKRSATVTIRNGLEEKTFEVTQDGIVLQPEEPVEGAIQMDAIGNSTAIKINSSIEWTAESTADWLTTKVNGTNELVVTASYNNLFGTRTGNVKLKAKTSISGLDDYIIEFSQPRNIWITGTEDVHDDLSATLVAGSSTTRYATNTTLKLGKITWEFSEFIIAPGGVWFDVNGWPDAGTANFHLWLYESSCEMTSSGNGFGGWNGIYPAFSADEIKGIRKLAIEVTNDELNPGKLKIVLYVNDKEKGTMRNRENAYNDPSEEGQVIYFGYTDSQPGCQCTIKSFTIENYE